MAAERSARAHVLTIPTRRKDNGVYSPVDNAELCSYLDTALKRSGTERLIVPGGAALRQEGVL